ncbi:MAG: hypothetical protein CXT78_06815 [Thaumarchaeota archaeon]|nr:MAG: hypothetical protein CXT78_06815 [Nitrososphaerota archaeon]
MRVALVSAFIEDQVYEHKLDDSFMKNTICKEDHFYHRIAKALSKKNIEVVIFYPSKEKIEKKFVHKFGHEIVRVPVKYIPFIHEPIVYSPRLVEIIKNEFDICQFVSGYYVMYKVPDMFDYIVSKLHNKIPIIARWAGGNHEWMTILRKPIKKKSLNKCQKILCSGKNEIGNLKKIFDIPSEKISYLINPIDLDIFKKRDKIETKKQLELDVKKKYFLYVGRLTINKGIEELLETFKEIQKIKKEIILILIGDGPLKNKIIEFAKKYNLENSILLKGRCSHNEISIHYNASSILFHIGTSGGLPNVIIEGIASGLPIIASYNGANEDFVNEKLGTGILIQPGNKSQLKDAIFMILKNEEKFSKNISNVIIDFTYEAFGEKLVKIYESIKKNKF